MPTATRSDEAGHLCIDTTALGSCPNLPGIHDSVDSFHWVFFKWLFIKKFPKAYIFFPHKS